MSTSRYVTPRIAKAGEFRTVTRGWFAGRWRDVFGGRAFIRIEVG